MAVEPGRISAGCLGAGAPGKALSMGSSEAGLGQEFWDKHSIWEEEILGGKQENKTGKAAKEGGLSSKLVL